MVPGTITGPFFQSNVLVRLISWNAKELTEQLYKHLSSLSLTYSDKMIIIRR